MPYFTGIPNGIKQTFTRIRRTSGGSADSYGDATFTESQTSGFRGMVQFPGTKGETVIIAGKEIEYDAVIYTGGTFVVGEDDVLLLPSSTSTAISTRYHVRAIRTVYDGTSVEHKQVFAAQEVV